MACLICRQAELVSGIVSVAFHRNEIGITINNIPAWVCPNCADAVVAEHVADKLLKVVEEISAAGVLEGVQDFQHL